MKQIHDNDTGAIFNVIEGGGHKIVVDILNKVSKDAEIKAKEVIADIPYFKNAYNVFALTPEENLEITRRITMTLDEAIKREKIGALRLEEDANQMKCAKESDATRDALLKIAEERMEIALYLEELKELRAQKVVHCKECRYADKYSHCALVKWWNKDDDYCSRGER